jgi:hypothetical protein
MELIIDEAKRISITSLRRPDSPDCDVQIVLADPLSDLAFDDPRKFEYQDGWARQRLTGLRAVPGLGCLVIDAKTAR